MARAISSLNNYPTSRACRFSYFPFTFSPGRNRLSEWLTPPSSKKSCFVFVFFPFLLLQKLFSWSKRMPFRFDASRLRDQWVFNLNWPLFSLYISIIPFKKYFNPSAGKDRTDTHKTRTPQWPLGRVSTPVSAFTESMKGNLSFCATIRARIHRHFAGSRGMLLSDFSSVRLKGWERERLLYNI